MNNSVLYYLLLVIPCLILPTTNARAYLSNDGPDLIGQICNEITKQDKIINCTNILRADPTIVSAKKFVELSKAVLELGLKKGIEGQKFLKGVVKTDNSPAMDDCANIHYLGVVDEYEGVLRELKDEPALCSYDAQIAGDLSDNCEAVLASAHIVNPAVSALNRQTSFLSLIAVLATNKL